MWNKRPQMAGLLVSLSLLAAASNWQPQLFTPSAQAAPAETAQMLQGILVDAETEVPLSGVYVRQQEALNATFSDSAGFFELKLAPGFSGLVVFECEGYESIALNFTSSQTRLKIHLQPQTQFSTHLPGPQQRRTPSRRPDQIFGSEFTAFYQMNYTLFHQANLSLGGIVLNEFGLSGNVQPFQTPLTFRGRFFRSRMPVDIDNFPFQPAFYINRQFAKIGAGWVHELDGPMELYLGGDLVLDYRSPDNRSSQDQQPILFTGSLLDYEQTRLGAGLNAALGWQLSERFTLFPEFTLYPLALNFVNRNSDGLLYTLGADLGARLQFEIIPGVYAVGQYHTQLWYGFGANALENNHNFHIGLSLDPWTMAEELL